MLSEDVCCWTEVTQGNGYGEIFYAEGVSVYIWTYQRIFFKINHTSFVVNSRRHPHQLKIKLQSNSVITS
jgi:hypothetical protein